MKAIRIYTPAETTYPNPEKLVIMDNVLFTQINIGNFKRSSAIKLIPVMQEAARQFKLNISYEKKFKTAERYAMRCVKYN